MLTDRLFFAFRPDAAVAGQIHAMALRLREVHGLKGKPLAPERLHITLLFLGDHEGLPSKLVAAADGIARDLQAAPFEVSLDRMMSFTSTRPAAPLVLCREESSPPLDALRRQLGADARGFKPHVTLLYDAKRITAEEVAPVRWRAIEVLLIRSLINHSRHEVLGCYPLR